MVTGPKNLDPEKHFSGSSWCFHLHNRPSDVGHLIVIQLNINPSIDYDLGTVEDVPNSPLSVRKNIFISNICRY